MHSSVRPSLLVRPIREPALTQSFMTF